MLTACRCLFFLALFFFAHGLRASICQPSVEIKAGYFFFTDPKMRSVYDKGGLDIQLSSSIPLWKWLQLYTSVEYLEKEGRSIHLHQKTKIWQVPVTLGLKASMPIWRSTFYYITLAPRFFYAHVHNDSSYVDRDLERNGIGGFLGTGFTIIPCSNFIIDIFGEYSYARTRFHSLYTSVYTRNIQIGGFVFGGGVGYKF